MSFHRKTQIVWLPQDWGKMLPYLALMVTIMATGLSAMFVRWANAPGTVTVFFRTALASIILLPFLLHRNWPLKLTTPISNLRWLPFALLGGLFIALDQGAWSTAVMMTKVANATYFNSIAPLWVAIYALLVLRERLGNLFWCGLGLTLSGSFFILGRDLLYSPHLGQGDIWGVISSIFYGGYFIVTQFGRRYTDTLTYTWTATITCAIALFCINLLLQQPLNGYPVATYLVFLGAALVSQVIGYLAMGFALGHLPASVVSPTLLGKPVFTALLAIPLFGEYLSMGEIVGGVLVLAGIYLINLSKDRFISG
jgi:drug/metabolite transporter (DMT)-like permease